MAQFRCRGHRGRAASRNACPESRLNRLALSKSEYKSAKKTITGPDGTDHLHKWDRQADNAGFRGKHCSCFTEGQGYVLGGSVGDQRRSRFDLALLAIKFHAEVLPQLTPAGFNEEDPLGEGLAKGLARCIDNAARTALPCKARHPRIKIVRRPRGRLPLATTYPLTGTDSATTDRQAFHSPSLTSGPCSTKRNCFPVAVSSTVKFWRVLPWTGTTTLGMRSASMSLRYASPVGPPAVYTAKVRPPSRRTTLDTFTPPPPGSRRLAPHRSLWTLMTRSVEVLISRAGFTVRVRMDFTPTSIRPA